MSIEINGLQNAATYNYQTICQALDQYSTFHNPIVDEFVEYISSLPYLDAEAKLLLYVHNDGRGYNKSWTKTCKHSLSITTSDLILGWKARIASSMDKHHWFEKKEIASLRAENEALKAGMEGMRGDMALLSMQVTDMMQQLDTVLKISEADRISNEKAADALLQIICTDYRDNNEVVFNKTYPADRQKVYCEHLIPAEFCDEDGIAFDINAIQALDC